MKWIRVLAIAAAVVIASLPASADMELRTWATTAAAPADGGSHSSSTSFNMVSRLGGPFVGSSESESFSLWGCSVTPVEGVFFATETEPECVTIRWTVPSLGGVAGFNVYRSSDEAGPFEKVNEEVLPAETPGAYEDRTVWPGSQFWYELWVVLSNGTEDRVSSGAVSVTTGGELVMRLYPAFPNPFREQAVIQHDVASVAGGVRLAIYDVTGRVVRTLESAAKRPGRYKVTWDGTNDSGGRVASGVYFCSLEAEGKRETRRIIFLR
jgi:hypothetical protein